jgi:Tfp pilus assembly protein PilX
MILSNLTSMLSKQLRRQDGFTMILVLGVLLVTSLLLVATFTAANGEIHLTSTDTSQKKAYYAAEAGIQDYEYHLTQDGNYLAYCTEPNPANPALNQFGSTAHRATVPSTNGESTNEQYAIQLLPAESSKELKCNPANLVETMLEEKGAATGTFRIESTGYSGGEEKTLVATFRNANFVSYVWYTKYETGDPAIYGLPPGGKPEYFNECGQFYGKRPGEGGSPVRCRNNFFINGESVNGPMHTEDHAGVCGSPTFGRTTNDRIEFGSDGFTGDEGFSSEGLGCGATPTFKGKHIPVNEVVSIEPPPGDEELKHLVEAPYLFKGKTELILEGGTMTVKTHVGTAEEVVTPAVAYPPNGIIYVEGGCSEAYSPFGPKPRYTASEPGSVDSTCGNVYVHGEYTNSLTIVAENDVVINGNITTPRNGSGTPTTNDLLGLIANNFVRIYHPVAKLYAGHAPELESASHKETVKVEAKTAAYAKELAVEVKEVGSEYEVLLLNAKSEVVEKTALFKEAKQILGLASTYVTYKEGAKYSEGKSEKLKKLTAKGLNEACKNSPKGEVEKFNAEHEECEYTILPSECDAPNSNLDLEEPVIYAAMLAVKHAVIVDNFDCGLANLKNLNVYGAVAGLYTDGFTGEFSGSSIIHGYPYDANYDDRLQIEEPPHFLNPIQASWYIQRQTVAPNPSG